MKTTKLLSILFLSAFLLATLSFNSFNRKVIAVVFNKEMTRQDLTDLQKNLKDKNIVLTFNETKFSKNRLVYIDFSIDFGDGYSGSSKSIISKRREIGFLRDYTENAETPFMVGKFK